MTHFTVRHLNQKVVYWSWDGESTNEYGEPNNIGSPAQLNVRWEKKDEETQDANGNIVKTEIRAAVNQAITIGSLFWLGALADIPNSPTDIYQVMISERIPTVKGRHTRRILKLARYSDVLPDLTASPGTGTG